MSECRGRLRFASASGRSPWSGLAADGPIMLGDAADPLAALADLDRRSRTVRHAGFFSYDLGRWFESVPTVARDDLGLPLFAFGACADNRTGCRPWDPASELAAPSAVRIVGADAIGSTFTRAAYEAAVRRCLDYIAAGDVFQINLSQRLAVRTGVSPDALFDRLQRRFPAEYGALLDVDDRVPRPGSPGRFALVSNSPELFLRVTRLADGRRRIVNRPIKGTRPNAPGMAAELLASEKDRAELAMIVDLQRNDLGRICEIGSVVVAEPRMIETHPTVLHGVATIEGVLRDNVTLTDVLRATFPCGSVTGCPKVRAMQIVDELEPVRRGPYCGAIGWVGGGEMELAVAIRTVTMIDDVAYLPVGGGVVADSDPAAEYEETLVKARAVLAALGGG